MITAAMLQLIQDAGEGVLVLLEYVEEAEFMRSRLTRHEVQRQLALMAATLTDLGPAAQAAMPELPWAGWVQLGRALATPELADDAAWFGARSLVPATLSWLRVYRQQTPALFSYRVE